MPVIDWMHSLPRFVPAVAVLGLFGLAAFLPPTVAWIPLLGVALFITWLLYLTWPRLTRPEKLLRFAVLVLVLAVTVARALPQSA